MVSVAYFLGVLFQYQPPVIDHITPMLFHCCVLYTFWQMTIELLLPESNILCISFVKSRVQGISRMHNIPTIVSPLHYCWGKNMSVPRPVTSIPLLLIWPLPESIHYTSKTSHSLCRYVGRYEVRFQDQKHHRSSYPYIVWYHNTNILISTHVQMYILTYIDRYAWYVQERAWLFWSCSSAWLISHLSYHHRPCMCHVSSLDWKKIIAFFCSKK